MKTTYLKTLALAVLTISTMASCNDWLDVSPKSQIEENDQFSRPSGFRDQLTGVYTQMSQATMYGNNMGFGFAEVLSQNYDVDPNGAWQPVAEYDYANDKVKPTINDIWNNTYSCIANLNIMLQNIKNANPSMFPNNEYYLCYGEGLGLRAFLHFELMRFFASAPAMNGSDKGVPYVTEYSTEVAGQKSVNETMDLIIADLLEAEKYLAHDSLYASENHYDFRDHRYYYNYYANELVLSRAYLWKGDKENALKHAQSIISVIDQELYSSPFAWVHFTSMQASNMRDRDMIFSTEHLFHLAMDKTYWEETTNFYFKSAGGSSALSPSDTKASKIYEVGQALGNDYRMLRGYEQDGDKRYMCKFWVVEGSSYVNMYPVLRLTEAYYIAAECLKNTNPTKAIELLNTVRTNRGLNLDSNMLPDNLTADEIQKEVYKEYQKEFVGEGGQLFFYCKRLNLPTIEGASRPAGKSIYVLPIPDTDKEFGGYTN